MPDLTITLANISSFINDVEKVFPDVVVEAAVNSAALIQNRIQETGIGSDDSQLGDYTDGLYKSKRQAIGLPTGFVNLTFSGDMWRDVKLLEVKKVGGFTTATIGASSSENDDKLFYNAIRYNDDILTVTDSEEKEIQEILDEGLQALVDANF